MYARLKHLVFWPEKDILRATMPLDSIKHCPSYVAIIDCFEIFLEHPCNLLARAQTFSAQHSQILD
jgi:hypothetical protein